ncbi:MAG: Xaa-Pro peptidase family protein [Roseiflexaceae bacterium]
MNHTNEELGRANTALAVLGCDAALLSSLANVTYVSGYEVPIPIGAGAEFSYGIPLALCGRAAPAGCLIVPDGGAPAAGEQSRLAELLAFDTFDGFRAKDSHASFIARIGQALRQAGLGNSAAVLGVEFRTMPYVISTLLRVEFPSITLVDAGPALQQARMTKTEREIELLRRAVRIGDIGHHALAELVREAGRDEFAIWAELTSRMYRAAGHEIPIVGELVTGPRTCTVNYPGGPRTRVTEPGDAALMDISQRIDGYWSDCTNTHIVGGVTPSAEQTRYARASQAACEAAMDALRPGNRASDAWNAAEAAFQRHGLTSAHYAGHQIGVVVNEPPRLVAYDDTPIEPGMVFAVEPGVYEGPGGTFGARSEKMVLVTESGPEILSQFDWGI